MLRSMSAEDKGKMLAAMSSRERTKLLASMSDAERAEVMSLMSTKDKVHCCVMNRCQLGLCDELTLSVRDDSYQLTLSLTSISGYWLNSGCDVQSNQFYHLQSCLLFAQSQSAHLIISKICFCQFRHRLLNNEYGRQRCWRPCQMKIKRACWLQ